MTFTTDAETIGLVAGRGRYPLLLAEEARRHGKKIVVGAFHDDTDPALADLVDEMDWVYVGQMNKLIRVFKTRGVDKLIMAGQITPGRLFKGLRPDLRAVKWLATVKKRNADTLFSGIIQEFAKDGLTFLPAITFMEDHLAGDGVLGKVTLSRQMQADVDFGREIAREVSRLDIGQTVVVKNGTVLAVEAFEGTDKAILRGGELGRGDITVVKQAKENQDIRFDVPCIGMQTVANLITAGARTIAVEAGITLIIDKAAVLQALNKAKIAIVGFYDPQAAVQRRGVAP